MSTPATYDLAIYRGDTARWTFSFWTDEALTVPWDLTDLDLAAELREQTGSEVVATFAIDVDLPNIAHLSLDETVTAGLCAGRLAWDLEARNTVNTDVRTVLRGAASVTGDITHSGGTPPPD